MIEFRKSSRALVLTKENKILFIKRIKIGQEPYYVTPGGGIEENENSLEALKRELLEETGSQVAEISFLFHLDDVDMRNSVDFYIAKEVSRGIPSGSEWVLSNEQNKYELYEASIEELDKMNIKPKIVKKALINALKKELGAK
ncbi:MAG: NUDIX domain-containing protein [Alphaproteobacteria bacterium]|nr:NUDIX domain-containing protein [Alphaproteobacteria bacterium]